MPRLSKIQTHRYKNNNNKKTTQKNYKCFPNHKKQNPSSDIAISTCTRTGPQHISYNIQHCKKVWSWCHNFLPVFVESCSLLKPFLPDPNTHQNTRSKPPCFLHELPPAPAPLTSAGGVLTDPLPNIPTELARQRDRTWDWAAQGGHGVSILGDAQSPGQRPLSSWQPQPSWALWSVFILFELFFSFTSIKLWPAGC